MAEVTAALVNAFRKETGLPLMDCKAALTEAGGDQEKAKEILRSKGKSLAGGRGDRETAFGRFGLYKSMSPGVGAIVELKCESAPVASNEEFIQLADDLARQLATGPGAATGEELLDQPSPSKKGLTLREQKEELFNRMREVFNVGRMARFDGPCGGYLHPGSVVHGVLLEVSGGNDAAAKDVCMHIASMNPLALKKEEIDPALVEKERELLRAAALAEGKPANIVEKMVEGRLRNFYAERVLTEQPFVKDDKVTVGKFAEQHGMSLQRFVHWELGGKS
jgi:elongation factor Ts